MALNKLSNKVVIQCYGENLGRFLSLCAHNGVDLYDLQMIEEDYIIGTIESSAIWTIHPFLHKTKTRLRILTKSGPRVWINRYRKRIVFPIAFLFILFLFGYVSGFIWKIDVQGNSYLSKETIISYLDEKKVRIGCKKSRIDCQSLELSLRKEMEDVIWASVSIKGTNLIIDIEERRSNSMPTSTEAKPFEVSVGYDLVASEDAVITSIITRSGYPMVKKGDRVKKGDILVSGKQEVFDDQNEVKQIYYVEADADIIAKVSRNYRDKIPKTAKEKVLTEKNVSSIALSVHDKQLEIPLSLKQYEESDLLKIQNQICLGADFYLPIIFTKSVSYEVNWKEHQIDKEEALSIAQENYKLYQKECENNQEKILNQSIKMTYKKNNYLVSGTVVLQKNIGILRASKENENMEGIKQREHE